MVRYFELAVEGGVRIMSVESGSPAAEAGLADGDVIVAWDGKPVGSIDELHRLLTEAYLHTSVEVTVLRRSQKLTRTVKPVELR
jgi:S1-C subfamily serine protease